MTRVNIDYTKSVIYKIVCKNTDITDLYIGSTTNFAKRKNCHKTMCNNINSKLYSLNVYNCIRNNGGWDNWVMIMVEQYNCNNGDELRARERYYIDALKPSLNKNIPMRTVDELNQYLKIYREYNREYHKRYVNNMLICDCGNQYSYANHKQHVNSQKHIKYMDNPFINMNL